MTLQIEHDAHTPMQKIVQNACVQTSNMKENIQNVGNWRQAGLNVAMKGPGSLSAAIPFLHRILRIVFHTQNLLHTNAFAQKLLHTGAFTYRDFYTQAPLHTDAFTHRSFNTQKVLHTEGFPHRH